MDSEIPILMITLQIPVLADTSVDQVLNEIGERVSQALKEIRKRQQVSDFETISQQEFKASTLHETEESFSDETREDLLTRLGYPSSR